MNRILVFGGAGFGGSGIIKELLKDENEVTILDIIPKAHSPFFGTEHKLNYIWKSVHDVTPDDVEGYNIILYLSAQADVPMGFTSPKWTCYQNVDGIISVLEACKHIDTIEKFILASSGNVYGIPEYLPIDEKHPLVPHNPYSFSKASQELACIAYHNAYDVPITILSNGIVTGPGMRREIFIFKWLYNILKDNMVYLEGGKQTRDITYVSDVIDGWIKTINIEPQLVKGEKFQISYGKEITVEHILLECFKICKKEPVYKVVPYRPGEERQREMFDNSKSKRVLNYQPKIDPIKAIELTYEWIKNKVM